MPIRSREDAVEVQDRIQRIFDAPASERGAAVRSLFVEVLDFNAASGNRGLGCCAEQYGPAHFRGTCRLFWRVYK